MSAKELTTKSPEQWAQYKCEHLDETFKWPQHLIAEQLPLFEGWKVSYDATGANPCLAKTYQFANFEGVKLALKELTLIADEQDHHPKAEFSFNYLSLAWNTHSAGGLSGNDWICAARCDQALKHIG